MVLSGGLSSSGECIRKWWFGSGGVCSMHNALGGVDSFCGGGIMKICTQALEKKGFHFFSKELRRWDCNV